MTNLPSAVLPVLRRTMLHNPTTKISIRHRSPIFLTLTRSNTKAIQNSALLRQVVTVLERPIAVPSVRADPSSANTANLRRVLLIGLGLAAAVLAAALRALVAVGEQQLARRERVVAADQLPQDVALVLRHFLRVHDAVGVFAVVVEAAADAVLVVGLAACVPFMKMLAYGRFFWMVEWIMGNVHHRSLPFFAWKLFTSMFSARVTAHSSSFKMPDATYAERDWPIESVSLSSAGRAPLKGTPWCLLND